MQANQGQDGELGILNVVALYVQDIHQFHFSAAEMKDFVMLVFTSCDFVVNVDTSALRRYWQVRLDDELQTVAVGVPTQYGFAKLAVVFEYSKQCCLRDALFGKPSFEALALGFDP